MSPRPKLYCTVADWLLDSKTTLSDCEDILAEDFLVDFTKNYKDSYYSLASEDKSLQDTIRAHTDIRKSKEDLFPKVLEMACCWFPDSSKEIGKSNLETLLSHLGFSDIKIDDAEQEPGTKSPLNEYENYTVQRKQYTVFQHSHPIANFGSNMRTKEIRIICIPTPKKKALNQILEIITELPMNKQPVLILLNCALTDTDRNRLARESKDEALGNTLFAVIDKTIMVYMAKKYDESAIKMNKMLMSLIMPYAYCQPYKPDSPKIPVEMFRGRTKELKDIIDPEGPNFVYGGRQLGKSALLRQAEQKINKNKNEKAIYIEIKGKDYDKTVREIYKELTEGIYKILNKEDCKLSDDPIEAWEDLTKAIKNRFRPGYTQEISYLLLMLDEADDFVKSWKDVNYRPFDILKNLQINSDGKFKFIIAGLQNIVKFNRKELLDSNNTLINNICTGKEEPIKPLEPRWARELLEIPLHYLGFRFPKDKKGENLLYLILANTNGFPGLIQMYCANLIKSMRNDYANNTYSVANTPPYEINELHISSVLADPEFRKAVKEKFFQTLGLDKEDKYYRRIAFTIACMRHNKYPHYHLGYSPEDIKTFCEDWKIKKLESIETDKLKDLLDELTDLNILKNTTDENHYLFTRDNFFTMLGTVDEILEEIAKNE